MRIRAGYTPPRGVDEQRELRRGGDWLFGYCMGLVTRRHGTVWLTVKWGAAARVPSHRP